LIWTIRWSHDRSLPMKQIFMVTFWEGEGPSLIIPQVLVNARDEQGSNQVDALHQKLISLLLLLLCSKRFLPETSKSRNNRLMLTMARLDLVIRINLKSSAIHTLSLHTRLYVIEWLCWIGLRRLSSKPNVLRTFAKIFRPILLWLYRVGQSAASAQCCVKLIGLHSVRIIGVFAKGEPIGIIGDCVHVMLEGD